MALSILLFTHQFSAPTETFIYHDAVALQAYSQVKVVCFHRQNETLRPFAPLEVIPFQPGWWQQKWRNLLYKFNLSLSFYHPLLQKQLQAIIEDFQPDVLHLHFGIQALHFIDNIDFTGPIFITFHGYDATKIVKKSTVYRKRLQRLFLQKNVFPLATSASLFEYMAQYKLRSARSQVLYSGINLELFQLSRDQPASEAMTFTQISSFRSKKGHYFLLQAFRKLLSRHPEKRLQLMLAGGGPLEGEMKTLASQLGIASSVHFLGWITQAEAVKLLSESHVFVHPSITDQDGDMESTTVAILEAMAMELPIFATRHSGIPEIVTHSVNGLLAEERDVDGYVACLEALMDWGRQPQNRQKIIDQFSHQMHIQQLLRAYEEAIIEIEVR